MNPDITVTIDGRDVTADPTWNHIHGHGSADFEIPEEEARKLNIVARETEVAIYTGSDKRRFHGRVSSKPRYTSEGTAEISAVGFKDKADKADTRRHYLSYGLDNWEEMDGGEHAYAVEDNKVSSDVRKTTLRNFISTGTSMSVGDRNGAVCFIQGDTITSVAFTVSGDVDANNNVRLSSGDGPAGALTSENDWTSTGAKDFTLATANQDMVALMYRRGASAAVVGTNVRQVLSNLRVRCRAPSDAVTSDEVLIDTGADLGFDTSGVSSSLATNIMPLDWTGGAWSGLFDYVCMLEDGWWRVLDDRGDGPYLEANKWANSRVFKVNQASAIVNLKAQEPYDGIVVHYFTPGGAPRQVTAGSTDPGDLIYPVVLQDRQKNSTFPQAVADALLARIQSDSWAGDIDMVSALSENGVDDPYDMLDGDKIEVTDWDMGESFQHRVFGVSCSSVGVTAHIEPAGLPDESMLALKGLRKARNQRRVFVGNNPNTEYGGFTGQMFKKFLHDNWTRGYGDSQHDVDDLFRLYNRFRAERGMKRISKRAYGRRFL